MFLKMIVVPKIPVHLLPDVDNGATDWKESSSKLSPVETIGLEVAALHSQDSSETKKSISKNPSVLVEGKKYTCPECPYSSNYISNMNRHKKRHGGSKLSCSHCSASFYSLYELKVHISAHHFQKLACNICGKKFKSRSGLYGHRAVEHSTGPEPFECHLCDKKYFLKGQYKNHVNSHLTSKAGTIYECPMEGCEKKYSQEQSYKTHVQTCTGASPKKVCDVCSKEFGSPQALKDHKKGAHQNEMLYCQCGKSYRWRGSFYNHLKQCKYNT